VRGEWTNAHILRRSSLGRLGKWWNSVSVSLDIASRVGSVLDMDSATRSRLELDMYLVFYDARL